MQVLRKQASLARSLHEAGNELGLKDAGYYALDALRIEAGRRAWAAELGSDETPFEAGLSYAVKLDKPADFMGKSALLKLQGQPLRKKLVKVVLGSAQRCAWGGEALSIRGQAVGELSSVGWSPKANARVALADLRGEAAQQAHRGTSVDIDQWGEPVAASAWDGWPPKA